jgi:hypothetical protein
MTPKRSQIFRAIASGESIARIADRLGLTYGEAWLQLSHAIAELNRKGSSAVEPLRWQQYLVLMRVVDQALAAFDQSTEEGATEIANQRIEGQHGNSELRIAGESVKHDVHVRKSAGDLRFLELAMNATRKIRGLFGIGAVN